MTKALSSRESIDNSDTWVCIGTGPSLTTEDIDYCRSRGWSLATCNNAIKFAPDAKIHHAHDDRWWDRYAHIAKATKADLSTSVYTTAQRHNIRFIQLRYEYGFSLTNGVAYAGGPLSGFQLPQIVAWRKPKQILLLGYDMQWTGGKSHVDGDHPEDWPNAHLLEERIKYFAAAADCGIPVLNCSRESAIMSLPRVSLQDVD